MVIEDPKEDEVVRDHKVTKVLEDQNLEVHKEIRVHKVIKVVIQDHKVVKVVEERKDLKDIKVHHQQD